MKFERRPKSNGTCYYRFSYYDSKLKKQIHLSKDEVRKRFGRDIVTEDEALECLRLLSAKFETEKIRIKRRLEWQDKFYSFAKLAELYEEKQKKKAPNSWQNNCFYLRHYVLYFFLHKQKINLIDLWVDHFEKFKNWLETAEQIRGRGVIAYPDRDATISSHSTVPLATEDLVASATRFLATPECTMGKIFTAPSDKQLYLPKMGSLLRW